MPEQLLTILKVCLLVLLYLFFLRVLRAVWADLGAGRGGGSGRAAGSGAGDAAVRGSGRRPPAPSALVAIEPPELVGTRFALAAVTTVGRAEGSTVRLEDSYLSQHHARIRHSDGVWYLEDLGSTNGTYLNRSRVTATSPLSRGDTIQVGNVVLEVA